MFSTSAVGAGTGNIAGNSSINPFTFSGTISGVSGTVTTLNVMPTYVSAFTPSTSNSAQVFDGVATGDLPFDNPSVPGGQLASGVGFMGTNSLSGTTANSPWFSFTVNSSVPTSFTVGLFFTNGSGTVTSASIGQGAIGTAKPGPSLSKTSLGSNINALFFTITGAVAGDTFTVFGTGGGGLFDENIDIMGITFDSTPEPTTFAGCAAAGLALVWLSRRRKKVSMPGYGQGPIFSR